MSRRCQHVRNMSTVTNSAFPDINTFRCHHSSRRQFHKFTFPDGTYLEAHMSRCSHISRLSTFPDLIMSPFPDVYNLWCPRVEVRVTLCLIVSRREWPNDYIGLCQPTHAQQFCANSAFGNSFTNKPRDQSREAQPGYVFRRVICMSLQTKCVTFR